MVNTNWIQEGKDHYWLNFGKDESFYDQQGAVITKGEGSYIFDLEGNRYLDTMGGQCTLTLGYNPAPVIEAMEKQMRKIATNPSGWPATTETIAFAKKLAELSPAHQKVFFSCNGTDGNESAVKIAKQYYRLKGAEGKYKAIVRKGEYHGASLAMISGGGYTFRRKTFEPLPAGFVHINVPYCYRCPYEKSYPSCGAYCAGDLERELQFHDPSSIACILLELTTGGGGVLPPPKEYVQKIRDICDEYGILMIVDEVVTGFGRTGTWFAYQQFDVVPDMVVFGKGAAAGFYPVSGVLVKEDIASLFSGHSDQMFHHGYTFGGAPLGSAAALANIETLESLQILEKVNRDNQYCVERFQRLQQSSSIIGDFRHHGLMFALEFVQDTRLKERFASEKALKQFIISTGQSLGLHLGMMENILLLMPSLDISKEDLTFMCDGVEQLVRKAEESLQAFAAPYGA